MSAHIGQFAALLHGAAQIEANAQLVRLFQSCLYVRLPCPIEWAAITEGRYATEVAMGVGEPDA